MERLTIKELAPYLPYGLKIRNILGKGSIWTLTRFNIEQFSDDDKPLLRPLSQLTEEIEHNGKEFTPMLELEKIRKNIEVYRPLNLHYPIEITIQTEDYSQEIDLHDGYLIMQKLLEWHFDVFGLTDRCLALPIDRREVRS